MDFSTGSAVDDVMDTEYFENSESTGYGHYMEHLDQENRFDEPDYTNDVPRRPPKTSGPSSQRKSPVLLPPRSQKRKAAQDFFIFEDKTAQKRPQRQRQYYGSNLPALPEVNNTEYHTYSLHHEIRQNWYDYYEQSVEADGQDRFVQFLLEMRTDPVPLKEAVFGSYDWLSSDSENDVWLWLTDKKYQRHWSMKQRNGFKKALKYVRSELLALGESGASSEAEEEMHQKFKSYLVEVMNKKLEILKITNITIDGATHVSAMRFIPRGEDKHLVYRRDFSRREQRRIDKFWSDHWAPGEERRYPSNVIDVLWFPDTVHKLNSSDTEPNSATAGDFVIDTESGDAASRIASLYRLNKKLDVLHAGLGIWDSATSMRMTMVGDLLSGSLYVVVDDTRS